MFCKVDVPTCAQMIAAADELHIPISTWNPRDFTFFFFPIGEWRTDLPWFHVNFLEDPWVMVVFVFLSTHASFPVTCCSYIFSYSHISGLWLIVLKDFVLWKYTLRNKRLPTACLLDTSQHLFRQAPFCMKMLILVYRFPHGLFYFPVCSGCFSTLKIPIFKWDIFQYLVPMFVGFLVCQSMELYTFFPLMQSRNYNVNILLMEIQKH